MIGITVTAGPTPVSAAVDGAGVGVLQGVNGSAKPSSGRRPATVITGLGPVASAGGEGPTLAAAGGAAVPRATHLPARKLARVEKAVIEVEALSDTDA